MNARAALVALCLLAAACGPSASASPSPIGETPAESATTSPSGAPTASSSVAPTPTAVDCSGNLTPNLFGQVDASDPSIEFSDAYCIVRFTLFMSAEGTGAALVTADGTVIYTVDVTNFATIGTEGAGSGERNVEVSPPIGIPANTSIELDLSGCTTCNSLIVSFEAASR